MARQGKSCPFSLVSFLPFCPWQLEQWRQQQQEPGLLAMVEEVGQPVLPEGVVVKGLSEPGRSEQEQVWLSALQGYRD